MVLIIRERARLKQVEQMLQTLGVYIKIAVDIEKGILAGEGRQHAECEAALLKNDSEQKDIWGADWIPFTQKMAWVRLLSKDDNLIKSRNQSAVIISFRDNYQGKKTGSLF